MPTWDQQYFSQLSMMIEKNLQLTEPSAKVAAAHPEMLQYLLCEKMGMSLDKSRLEVVAFVRFAEQQGVLPTGSERRFLDRAAELPGHPIVDDDED